MITDDDNPHENIKGEIKVDEETFEIEVFFMYQSVALSEAIVPSFENKYRVRELYGDCKYSPEKLIIKVDKEEDTIFNGKYEELVFVRETNTGDGSLC